MLNMSNAIFRSRYGAPNLARVTAPRFVHMGVNLAGLEFSESQIPGTFGTHYFTFTEEYMQSFH